MAHKQIVLIRHSYALPENHRGDFSRELSERGHQVATSLGRRLAQELTPQKVLLSPATRVQETFSKINEQLGLTGIESVHEILYQGNRSDYLSILEDISENIEVVWLIAHNPTITFLAQEFAENDVIGMSPGTAIVLNSSCETWAEASGSNWGMAQFIDSKQL